MTDGLKDMMNALEADTDVKVVVFDSADPDYFLAHVDVVNAAELDLTPGVTGMAPWPDVARRLELAPFVTVASVRGRARGVGSEFICAMDVVYASRERAILCQPEVPFGFIPGGGGLERLWHRTGRNRALEIIVGGEDFDADLAERYGWVNRAVPDAELDGLVDRFARRVASFDAAAIAAAKEVLREHEGLPPAEDFTKTETRFFGLYARENVQRLVGELVEEGLQQRSDVELDLASRLGPRA